MTVQETLRNQSPLSDPAITLTRADLIKGLQLEIVPALVAALGEDTAEHACAEIDDAIVTTVDALAQRTPTGAA